MTSQQKTTIDQVVKRIERLNNSQTVSVHDLRKGHISLLVFNIKDSVDVVRTTTFCNIEINTKGNITKGFLNELTPKTETKYPYMN
tara:strand:+ start:1129 stop:1386 length:258 start_codon:yes stop_codon:yes gene_type:complete